MCQIRKLEASEVEFSVSVEPEDIPVRGNFMCTDEPELDREAEDEVIARLDRGEVEAWCYVKVTARWNGFRAFVGLGGCCLGRSYTADVVADEHGLRDDALDALNAEIMAQASKLSGLVA